MLAGFACTINVTYMNTKPGPKPSGVEKVVYYRRVVPDMVKKLDEFLFGPDHTGAEAAAKAGAETRNKVVDMIADDPAPNKEEAHASKVLVQCWRNMNAAGNPVSPEDMVNSLKGVSLGNVKALLEDVDRLTKEVELFEKKREAWLRATESQQVAYWRDRAIRAEGVPNRDGVDQTR